MILKPNLLLPTQNDIDPYLWDNFKKKFASKIYLM